MTGREYLEGLRSIRRRVRSLQESYNTLKYDMYALQALNYERERVSGTPPQTEVMDLNLLEALEQRKAELVSEWAALLRWRADAMQYIGAIANDNYRIILVSRYVNGKSWETVSKTIGYSRAQVDRIHHKAMKAFCEIFYSKTKDETE